MSDFLPKDYEIPKSPGVFMRFEDGRNSIRVLSSAVVGWEYFNKDNKPVRSKEAFEDVPSDIKKDGKVKPFWAFVVWNYNVRMVQILEVTQKTIMNGIKSLADNPKWGHPTKYDIAINKTGEGLDSEYTVQGEPPLSEPSADIQAIYKAKPINLEALFTGGDPLEAADASASPDRYATVPEHLRPKKSESADVDGPQVGVDMPL